MITNCRMILKNYVLSMIFIAVGLFLQYSNLEASTFSDDKDSSNSTYSQYYQNEEFQKLLELASRGSSDAQYDIGAYYHSQNQHIAAFQYFLLSSQQRHPLSQFNLALCYQKGTGIEINQTEAFKYYKMAAKQGLPIAQNNLASCYAEGYGVEKNLAKAFKYYKMAAETGLAAAQYNLAYCYRNGYGVATNLIKALQYYDFAAKQGNHAAQNDLMNTIEELRTQTTACKTN